MGAKVNLFELAAEYQRRLAVEEALDEAPEPVTEAERAYLRLTQWNDGEFKVFRKGKQIHPPLP